MIRKLLTGLAVVSFATTPIIAQAAPRDAAPVAESEEFGAAGSWPVVVAILALIAGSIIILLDDDDNDLPTSP